MVAADGRWGGLGARQLGWIGLAVAALVVPAAAPWGSSRQPLWLALALLFALLLAGLGGESCARWPVWRRAVALGIAALVSLALVALGGGAFAATYPVLVAAFAGSVLAARLAFAFAGVEALGLLIAFRLSGLSLPSAATYALIFGGLLLFVVHTAQVARAESAARRALEAAQARLAESSADRERLRIARELHDVLGHRLTALSLTLEAAAHVDGDARESAVLEAQVLTKRLLRDVRQVVSATRDEPFDLPRALRALAAESRGLAVHLALPDAAPGSAAPPAAAARVVLRCAQEAITNAARHGRAANLWLEIAADERGLRLVARDDGRAPDVIRPGHGLAGVRERVGELGGTANWRVAANGGFELSVVLPAAAEAER